MKTKRYEKNSLKLWQTYIVLILYASVCVCQTAIVSSLIRTKKERKKDFVSLSFMIHQGINIHAVSGNFFVRLAAG
ncbi:hypothetical protein QVD17_04456 [Tagetes erecta]|uniref:Uncharacterized protein n=1 Tax=Tagetes erecta TaxID=13708 RepID=A0AAD8PAR1_TARER|nr:hypothetical protein QVD17_04456 [Tagetes erecta]